MNSGTRPPNPPAVPKSNDNISPSKGELLISVSTEKIEGSWPDEKIGLSGSYKGDQGTGTIFEH
jgi:hypothetical protein